MKTKMTLALAAILTSSAFAAFQAPLPEFKNEKQLAEWRAEMAAKETPQTTTEDTAFYTGKPYLESTNSYAFKYRSYNPELARWTSEDPSGFPDGANGNVYAPNPNFEFDPDGLAKISFTSNSFTASGSALNCNARGEYEYELDTVGGYTFTKTTGAWTSAMLGTHTDNSDPNDKISAALGAFVVRETGMDSGIGWFTNWVILGANFNITQDTNGIVTTTEWHAHTSEKIYANKYTYE